MTSETDDTSPDRDPGGDRLGPERLLAFSDGVVAIALTLLVLPLVELVPEINPHRSGFELITEHLPAFGSFLLSFVVIGRFWVSHHRLFDRARSVSPNLVRLNLFWLLTIVVMPFPTNMTAVYGVDPFTVRFYVATLFVSSAALTAMTVLIGRTLPPEEHVLLRHDAAVTTTVLLFVVLVVVLVLPDAAYWPLLLLLLSGPVERIASPLIHRLLGLPGG